MNSNGFKRLKTLLYEKGLINKEEMKNHLKKTYEKEKNNDRDFEEDTLNPFSAHSGNIMNKSQEEEGEGGFSFYSDEDLIMT